MPENKFEKNVQQQMEELRLRPSDAVWANVEKELKEKKRRRVIFFLFMLAGLSLLGYSVYTFTGNHSNSLAVTQTEQSPSTTEQSTITNNNSIVKRKIIEPVTTNRADQTKVQQPVQSNTQSSIQTQTQSHTQTINQSDRLIRSGSANDNVVLYDTTSLSGVPDGGIDITATPVVKKKMTAKNHKAVVPVKNTSSEASQQQRPDAEIQAPVITQTVIPATENNGSSTVPANNPSAESHDLAAEANNNKKVSDDSLIQRLIAQDSTVVARAIVASGINPMKQTKKKIYPKLKWGPDVSIGTTFSRNTIFPFSSSQEKALRDAYQASTNSPGGTAVPLQLPSAVHSGIGFKAGVAVQLQLSKRSSLVSGLRYTYLNEKIKVGTYRDTLVYSVASSFGLNAATSVYRGAATQQYTNKYHFVELPLLYQLQLNKGKKLPMLWSVGLTTSYLISTNALVYDTAAHGIYYKNKQAFNKLHAGVQTGLSFRFGNEKKIQWQVGPELSLDLSQQLKQNIFTEKRYLFYGGIAGKMFFARKKK
jgi:hypothetical protein